MKSITKVDIKVQKAAKIKCGRFSSKPTNFTQPHLNTDQRFYEYLPSQHPELPCSLHLIRQPYAGRPSKRMRSAFTQAFAVFADLVNIAELMFNFDLHCQRLSDGGSLVMVPVPMATKVYVRIPKRSDLQ